MYPSLLDQASQNLNLDTLSIPSSPFSTIDAPGTLAKSTNLKPSIDNSFLNMSKSFFETSYSYLQQLLSNDNCEDSDILIVLHNLFIGLELGLKSVLSGFRQRNSDSWMVEISDIQNGHQLEDLIARIKREYYVSIGASSDNWLDNRLNIISKFVSSSKSFDLNFESTRYPIDKKGKPFDYLSNNMILDLVKLKLWIEVLYSIIEELAAIYDLLDGARSDYTV